MKIPLAIKNFLAYQKLNSKKTLFKITGISWRYSKMNLAGMKSLRWHRMKS